MWVWGWKLRGGWGAWLMKKEDLTRPGSLSGVGWERSDKGKRRKQCTLTGVCEGQWFTPPLIGHLPGAIPDARCRDEQDPALPGSAHGLSGSVHEAWLEGQRQTGRQGVGEMRIDTAILLLVIRTRCSVSNGVILKGSRRGSDAGQSVRWLWRTDSPLEFCIHCQEARGCRWPEEEEEW